MLSPAGVGSRKNPAPSIWSFDSGYGSHEEGAWQGPFYRHQSTSSNSLQGRLDGNVGLGLGFANFHIGEQTQPKIEAATIEPGLTELSVFTTSDQTYDDFWLPKIPTDDQTCLTCQFLNFADHDDSLKCDDCRPSDNVEPPLKGKEPLLLVQVTDSSVEDALLRPDISKQARCTACELSSLINPAVPSKCFSCSPREPNRVSPSPLSPSPESSDNRVKRSRAGRSSKLPLSALNTLQAWLDSHADNPYPSSEVKKQLAQACGITEKQVTTWFTNARARQLSPLDSWLSSGSENDSVKEEDVERAAAGSAYSAGFAYLPGARSPGYRRAGSVSGSSALSNPSRPPPSRRGKKKNYRRNRGQTLQVIEQAPAVSNTSPAENSGEQEVWQCTFCRQSLVPKSWRRHEETQHHTRAQWTCMLYGPRITYSSSSASARPSTASSFCAFCMQKDPSEEHFLTHHRISECAKRPLTDRTFYRPDHLRQHVKNFHSEALHDITQARWKKEGDKGKEREGWTCGFCGEALVTWNKRETHIANHFKEGMTMESWRDYAPPAELSKKSTKEEKKEKDKEHSHGLARLSRTFTRRSTRNSQKSAPEPFQQTPFTDAFDSALTGAQMPTTYAFSNPPVLPNINLDPLLGNNYDVSADWRQISHMTEPEYADSMTFDSQLQAQWDRSLMEFGVLGGYQGPWQPSS